MTYFKITLDKESNEGKEIIRNVQILNIARYLKTLPQIDIINIDASNMSAEIRNLKKYNVENNSTNEIFFELDVKDKIQTKSKRDINMLTEQIGVLQNMILADS